MHFFLDFALNALFNAAVEASVYSITAAISGNWNAGDFFKSMGMAAVSSGLQVGGIGCGLGNNFAMGLMSNMVNNTVTGAIFGDGLSFGDIPGMVVGAAVGTILPYYTPSGTNVFKNVASEVGINMFRGALTGFSSGAINAMVHDDPSLVWEGTVGGAISGFARTAAHNIIMGTAYQPLNENGEPISYGEDVVYRKGGIAGMMDIGYGLTLGRHIYTLEKDLDSDHIMNLRFHENYHVGDINAMGVAKFYGSILMDYIRYGFKGSYTKPGTLEYNARVHAYMKTLLWW